MCISFCSLALNHSRCFDQIAAIRINKLFSIRIDEYDFARLDYQNKSLKKIHNSTETA